MADLVIGGTSGLGLELARRLMPTDNEADKVIITGRHDPLAKNMEYRRFDLAAPELPERIGAFVIDLPPIKKLVYAAGFYQEGRITDLTDDDIRIMNQVGGLGLIHFTKSLLEKQGHLDELVTITSTSQWVPRKLEPVYNYVKAGAAHFTRAMVEDGRIDKVMVAAPSGMRTRFWAGVVRDDLNNMLDPYYVSREIMDARDDDYKFKEIRILREPPRTEVVEKR